MDVLREKHTVYFKRGKEIDATEYFHYLNASKQVFGYEFYSLNSVDYHHLKALLDERNITNKK